jgi:hypothetical protein
MKSVVMRTMLGPAPQPSGGFAAVARPERPGQQCRSRQRRIGEDRAPELHRMDTRPGEELRVRAQRAEHRGPSVDRATASIGSALPREDRGAVRSRS